MGPKMIPCSPHDSPEEALEALEGEYGIALIDSREASGQFCSFARSSVGQSDLT